jgi:spore germination protein YaaH
LKLYVAVPVNDKDFDYASIAKVSDGVILMNYDQHYPGGDPVPSPARIGSSRTCRTH